MTHLESSKKAEQAAVANRYEPIVWLSELYMILGVTQESVRRMRKDGKLPEPDIKLSLRSIGWNLSTLRAAGINIRLKNELVHGA